MIGIFVDTRLSLFRIAGTIVRTRIGCLEIHADCRVDVVWLAYRADFSAGSNREGDNDRGRSRKPDSLHRTPAGFTALVLDGYGLRECLPARPDVLKARWSEIEDKLLRGRYQPQPVRRVKIPKPDGGTRNLGIPTVIDRVIQQAVLQRLQPPCGSDSRARVHRGYGYSVHLNGATYCAI